MSWMLNESGGVPAAEAATILSRNSPDPDTSERLTVSLGFFSLSDLAMAVYASVKLWPRPEYQNSTVPEAVDASGGGAPPAPVVHAAIAAAGAAITAPASTCRRRIRLPPLGAGASLLCSNDNDDDPVGTTAVFLSLEICVDIIRLARLAPVEQRAFRPWPGGGYGEEGGYSGCVAAAHGAAVSWAEAAVRDQTCRSSRASVLPCKRRRPSGHCSTSSRAPAEPA